MLEEERRRHKEAEANLQRKIDKRAERGDVLSDCSFGSNGETGRGDKVVGRTAYSLRPNPFPFGRGQPLAATNADSFALAPPPLQMTSSPRLGGTTRTCAGWTWPPAGTSAPTGTSARSAAAPRGGSSRATAARGKHTATFYPLQPTRPASGMPEECLTATTAILQGLAPQARACAGRAGGDQEEEGAKGRAQGPLVLPRLRRGRQGREGGTQAQGAGASGGGRGPAARAPEVHPQQDRLAKSYKLQSGGI